jgi:hypothetical protein
MRKTYSVAGYGANKRGHTVGINYTITAKTPEEARSMAQELADKGGYKHVRINAVREVSHD